MKTIYTTLPIYDKLSKQRYERSKRVSGDKAMLHPTITPRHRLPAFQWLDNGDGATSVSKVEAFNDTYTGVESNLSLTWPGGIYNTYGTFTSSGLNITSAICGVGGGIADTLIPVIEGHIYILRGTLTVNSGETPAIISAGLYPSSPTLTAGNNIITFRAVLTGNIGFTLYNTTSSDFSFTMATFSEIDDYLPINIYTGTLPALVTEGSNDWFIYESETLRFLLPEGEWYLKITMDNGYVYYSDWFFVDCIFNNYLTGWSPTTYNIFTTDGTIVKVADAQAGGGFTYTNSFSLSNLQDVVLIFYFHLNSGELPKVRLINTTTSVYEEHNIAEGLNVISFTASTAGSYYLRFSNTTNSNWFTTEIVCYPVYSEKYLIFDFEHSCNLGDINYESGFEQTLYLESEPLESAFPYVEKGAENGYGRFVPTYQRQDKTYIIRTKLVADYIIDVLQRLKLHDTIILTDLVGDVWDVEEIDTEQTWQFDDKYYALATITVDLGEGIAITGCCTAINEC